jgi:large subunit ribosomal protein L9
MELILKETIDTLGEEGDIVKVKAGYGRNYLIPQGKAMLATKTNLAILNQEQAKINANKEKLKKDAAILDKKISGTTITIEHRVGDENRLFGSVTNADIAEKLESIGIKVDKKKILLPEPIKTIGETIVQIKSGYQQISELTVKIEPLAE